MASANAAEFEGDAFRANRARALGQQPDGGVFGGMLAAEVVTVSAGATLCRITHSALPAELNLTSPWWCHEAMFSRMLADALTRGSDFRALVRDCLALANDFAPANDVADAIRAKYDRDALATLRNFAEIRPYDRIFEIDVIADLRAFSGVGRDVTDTRPDNPLGVLRTWSAAADILQLFIPGLRDSNGRLSAVGREGMHYRRSLSLTHWIRRRLDDLGGA